MFMNDEELSLMEKFVEIKRGYPRFIGVTYIAELWKLNGKSLHPTELYFICNVPEEERLNPFAYELHYAGYDTYLCYQLELPIPFSDFKAIYETRAQVQQIKTNLELARANHDLAHIEAYETDLEQFQTYLREVMTPQGHIRNLNQMTRGHARLIRHAIGNFLQKIQEPHPDLYQHLHQHLVIGVKCYWSINPINKGKADGRNMSQ